MNDHHDFDVYFIHIYSYSEPQIRIRNQKLYKTAVLFLLKYFRCDHKFLMSHQVINSNKSQQHFRLKNYEVYLFSNSLNIYSFGPDSIKKIIIDSKNRLLGFPNSLAIFKIIAYARSRSISIKHNVTLCILDSTSIYARSRNE